MFKWGKSVSGKSPDGTTAYLLLTKYGYIASALVSAALTLLYLVPASLDFAQTQSASFSMTIVLVCIAVLLGITFDGAKNYCLLHLSVNKVDVDIRDYESKKYPKLRKFAKSLVLFVFSYRIIFVILFLFTTIISLIATYAKTSADSITATKNSTPYQNVQTLIDARKQSIADLRKRNSTANNEIVINNNRIEDASNEFYRTRYKGNVYRNESAYRDANTRLSQEIGRNTQAIEQYNQEIATLQERQIALEKSIEGEGNLLTAGIVKTFSICKINISRDAANLWFAFVLELAILGFGFAYITSTNDRIRLWLIDKKDRDKVSDKFQATVATNAVLKQIKALSDDMKTSEQEIRTVLEKVSKVYEQFLTVGYQLHQTPAPSLLQESSQKKNRLPSDDIKVLVEYVTYNGKPLTSEQKAKVIGRFENLPDVYDNTHIQNILKDVLDDENNGHDDDLTLENQDEILPENTDEKNDFDERFRERKKPLTLTGKNVHDDVEKIVHKNMKKTVHETVHKNDSKNGQKKTVLELKNVLRTKFQGKSDPFILYIWGQWSELSTKRKSYGNVSKLVSQVLPGNRTISKTYVYNLINER